MARIGHSITSHERSLASVYTGVSVRSVRAKDTINQLKEEISNLSKLVEKGAGLSVGQENMVKELIRVRDELTRKTDEQGQTIEVSQHRYLFCTFAILSELQFNCR